MTDVTETARELLDLPFHRANDIEVVSATEETAHTRWPFDKSLVGNPEVPAVHGGVISALADLTGSAPFVGSLGRYTPTIDLRVDYLTHAGEAELEGFAEVRGRGETVGRVNIVVESGGDTCAKARGVYKLAP
ncbi:MAG: hypothetical protein ACI8UR_001862 [Natronomonas sp.]|jgi:uncharacterized protein (TIGR00369 family)|uniref:PaaI family thioesterase n=1 Tax=Natronomonas sp. TaxID=2184060 RepID=UPI0039890CEE